MRDKDREFICFFQVGGIFFFFRPDTKEKEPKRKDQGCVFSATPVLPSAKGQKLATLKQSALFDAEENTCA